MQVAGSRSNTKILPSPILSVRAALAIVSDHAIEHFFIDRDFELHLGQKIHDVFRSAVKLSVSLLTAESLDLGHGDALHADLGERIAHVVKLGTALIMAVRVSMAGSFVRWRFMNMRLMLSTVTPRPRSCVWLAVRDPGGVVVIGRVVGSGVRQAHGPAVTERLGDADLVIGVGRGGRSVAALAAWQLGLHVLVAGMQYRVKSCGSGTFAVRSR